MRLTTVLAACVAAFAAPAFASNPAIDPSALVQVADRKEAKPKPKPKPAAKANAPGTAAKPGAKTTAKTAPKAAPKAASKATAKKSPGKASKEVAKPAQPLGPGPLADFGKVEPSADVLHVANWVSYTRNNQRRNFILIDKKDARMYVFAADGKLRSSTPILLGKAVGDDAVPGIGEKPMKDIAEHEKTTPAGRFLARPGKNLSGENILWIDWNSAVSMHRLRQVAQEEKRVERMSTPDTSDNRISYGCVNVPHKFFDSVLRPAVVKKPGAFVYVLPETRTPQQQFGSFDVTKDAKKA